MNIQEQTACGVEQEIESWREKLLSIAPDAAHEKPADDRWSISEVIGHLVDSACNNHQRFVRAQHGSALVFPKYDQSHWVIAANYQAYDWASLVELWYQYNRVISVLMRRIPDDRMSTACTIEPYATCSLEFLVTDYLDHLRHHLEKLNARMVAP
ncbi:MAG: DinB family protein [Planctomycetota bacterium]